MLMTILHSLLVVSFLLLLLKCNSFVFCLFFSFFSLSTSLGIFILSLCLHLILELYSLFVNLVIPFFGMMPIVTFICIRYFLFVAYIISIILMRECIIIQLNVIVSLWVMLMMMMFLWLTSQLNETYWILSCWDIFSIIFMSPCISQSCLNKLGWWFNVVEARVNEWVIRKIISIIFVIELKIYLSWWFYIIQVFINEWIIR